MTESLESQNIPCAVHPQTLTRLRCTECEKPICPQCMVMYEVGFKCPTCAKKRPSHLEQVSGVLLLRVVPLGLLAGFGYGWLHPWLMGVGVLHFFGIPVLAFLLAYGLGKGLGGWLHRMVLHKIHPALSLLLVLGAVVGVLLASPFQQEVLAVWSIVGSLSENPYLAGNSSSLYVLGPGLRLLGAFFFIRGLYRAFQQ